MIVTQDNRTPRTEGNGSQELGWRLGTTRSHSQFYPHPLSLFFSLPLSSAPLCSLRAGPCQEASLKESEILINRVLCASPSFSFLSMDGSSYSWGTWEGLSFSRPPHAYPGQRRSVDIQGAVHHALTPRLAPLPPFCPCACMPCLLLADLVLFQPLCYQGLPCSPGQILVWEF